MGNNSIFNITNVSSSRIDSVNLDNPGFGQVFSDHMLEMEYTEGEWQKAEIKPFGSIEITPALNALHYGQSVFEGTKAYYVDEETVNLFRPQKNYERLMRSCERLCIPTLPENIFLDGIKELVKLDSQWVPKARGQALYIRPLVCAFDPVISASAADSYRFYIITSPVGAYYSEPVKLTTAPQYARSVKGGVGAAKTAGNYAASFYPTRQAQKEGFDQILWLDGVSHELVEEVGTMNIFFVIDDVLVTPELSGTILPGITRDSIVKLAKDWDMPVEERDVPIKEIMDAGESGSLQEAFGAGTAAVISPVKEIHHEDQSVTFDFDQRGPVGQKIYDTLTDIQWGRKEDSFEWVTPVSLDR